MSLYEKDFYAWANQQAALLKESRWLEADVGNIVEELETLARGEKRLLAELLKPLVASLLKWQHLPENREHSRKLEITLLRMKFRDFLNESPSLTAVMSDIIDHAYEISILWVERDTGLPETIFPATCPFTYDQMADDGFWPE